MLHSGEGPIPVVRWSGNLVAWANNLGGHCLLNHSGFPSYGENLAVSPLPKWGSNAKPPPGGGFPCTAAVLSAVDRWYAEGAAYDYASPGYSDATGHFTQLVWASTRFAGIGYAVWGDASGHRAVVCMDFYGPGNLLSAAAFKANVHALQ